MKAIKRIALDKVDQAIKFAFDRVWEWSEQFSSQRMPWLDGVLVEVAFPFGGNTQPIEHKLGRVPRGFIVINSEGAASQNLPSIVSKDAKFMVLNASGGMVLTLWVWG